MNPGYRKLLADRSARYHLSGAQEAYLKRLLIEATVNRMPDPTGLDHHHLENTTRKAASFAIQWILDCKKAGWKRLVEGDEFWFWRGFVE